MSGYFFKREFRGKILTSLPQGLIELGRSGAEIRLGSSLRVWGPLVTPCLGVIFIMIVTYYNAQGVIKQSIKWLKLYAT